MLEFEKNLGYRFKDSFLLKVALTHSSYANERKIDNNERLEFLGDSVLSIIISDYLFQHLPEEGEGRLSKIRASLICEQSLSRFAKKLSLEKYIRLGKGEELNGGRSRASILSDAFEAVLAAIYLDGGMGHARKWLLTLMQKALEKAVEVSNYRDDYKTMLQETVQKGDEGKVTYEMVSESGPDHSKVFEMEVLIDGIVKDIGTGTTKKEAEQEAARKVLESMGRI